MSKADICNLDVKKEKLSIWIVCNNKNGKQNIKNDLKLKEGCVYELYVLVNGKQKSKIFIT